MLREIVKWTVIYFADLFSRFVDWLLDEPYENFTGFDDDYYREEK